VTYKLTAQMKKEQVPVTVLFDREVSCFEAIIEYLKEERNLSYRQIAMLTNRNDRTIWTVYNRAKKKRQGAARVYELKKRMLRVPASIFTDRNVSVLETISEYLKDQRNMTYAEIAKVTNRDDRTIWTVYNRAKSKREIMKNVDD